MSFTLKSACSSKFVLRLDNNKISKIIINGIIPHLEKENGRISNIKRFIEPFVVNLHVYTPENIIADIKIIEKLTRQRSEQNEYSTHSQQ